MVSAEQLLEARRESRTAREALMRARKAASENVYNIKSTEVALREVEASTSEAVYAQVGTLFLYVGKQATEKRLESDLKTRRNQQEQLEELEGLFKQRVIKHAETLKKLEAQATEQINSDH